MFKRFIRLNSAFDALEARAISLRQSQEQQADEQEKLHESFRDEITSAHKVLSEVSVTATSLQSKIEEAASSAKDFMFINGFSRLLNSTFFMCLAIFFTALFCRSAIPRPILWFGKSQERIYSEKLFNPI
jgi:hypothetical protein